MNSFDMAIYDFINSFNNDALTMFMKIITNFAHAGVFIGLTVISFIIIKDRKIGKYIALNLLIVFILNQCLKYIIARPRPLVEPLIHASGYSFPSGHSMVSFAFYGFLIYLINEYMSSKKRIFAIVGLAVLILLIGISRIYLGVHYATDVIGGFLISLIYLAIYIKLIYKKEREKYE